MFLFPCLIRDEVCLSAHPLSVPTYLRHVTESSNLVRRFPMKSVTSHDISESKVKDQGHQWQFMQHKYTVSTLMYGLAKRQSRRLRASCSRTTNKKLIGRRQAARCFMSFSISLSLKVTQGHWK